MNNRTAAQNRKGIHASTIAKRSIRPTNFATRNSQAETGKPVAVEI